MRALKPEVDELKKNTAMINPWKSSRPQWRFIKKRVLIQWADVCPCCCSFPSLLPCSFSFRHQLNSVRKVSFGHTTYLHYDSILDLPFNIPVYGNHVSLFVLLMTITTILSTRLNSAGHFNPGNAGNENNDVPDAHHVPVHS
jgi:YidC/Oxa1 family membrane protein insertase